MRFTVTWLPRAEEILTELWNEAQDRSKITSAADAIDEILEQNPMDFGESRPDERRLGIISPLAVSFEVDVARRQVRVVGVWRIR